MPENPADWRSVVDPNTGRTYWYHRKTRQTTWVKPEFITDGENQNNSSEQVVDHRDVGKLQQKLQQQRRIDHKKEQPTATDNHQYQRHAQISVRNELHDKHQESYSANIPDDANAAGRAATVGNSYTEFTISTALQGIVDGNKSAIPFLNRTLHPCAAQLLGHEANAITLLTHCIVRHSPAASSEAAQIRHAALFLLYRLSCHRPFCAVHFHANQSWTALADVALRWRQGAGSDVWTLTALFCRLMVGPTHALITAQHERNIFNLLQSQCGCDDLVEALAEHPSALDAEMLHFSAVLAEHGMKLPTQWLLSIMKHSFSDEAVFAELVKRGAVDYLRMVASSGASDENLKSKARQILFDAIGRSSFVRERILDALLNISVDLSVLPIPLGPEPVLYRSATICAPSQNESMDLIEMLPLSEHDSLIILTHQESEIAEQAKRAAEKRMVDDGWCSIRSERTEESQDADGRDVDWIPRSGTAWRISSTILWTRCPTLRDLISGFWNEGGGSLELSVDACDEVLAILCRYMHSNILIPPADITKQLELIRVSSELGMQYLSDLCSDLLLHTSLSIETAAEIIAFCDSYGLAKLGKACSTFMQKGAISSPFHFSAEIGLDTSGNMYNHAVDDSNVIPRSAYLRDAIFASLQDVDAVLRDNPPRVPPLASQSSSVMVGHDFNNHENPAINRGNDESVVSIESSIAADVVMRNTGAQEHRTSIGVRNDIQKHNPEEAWEERNYDNSHHHEQQQHYHTQQNQTYATELTGKRGKPRSGGIYALLLQAQSEDEASSQPAIASAARQQRTRDGAVVPTAANKVPGKNVGPRPAPAVAQTKKSAAAAAARKAAAAAASGKVNTIETNKLPAEETTATKSSALPATHEETQNEMSYGSSSRSFHDNKLRGNDKLHRHGVPQEFDRRMSLQPEHEKSEHEKRIEHLTRPTKSLGHKPHEHSPQLEDVDQQKEQHISERYPVDFSRDDDVDENRNGNSRSEKNNRVNPQTTQKQQTCTFSSLAESEDSSGLKLKRSVSPSTAHVSNSGECSTASGAEIAAAAVAKQQPTPVANVRGSLTLLKTKTRRRRSINDVEDEMLHSHVLSKEHNENASNAGVATVSLDLSGFALDTLSSEQSMTPQHNRTLHHQISQPQQEEHTNASEPMHPCPDCGRRFREAALNKHVAICAKVFKQKRRTFDSSKMRIDSNPDLKDFVSNDVSRGNPRSRSRQPTQSTTGSGNAKWKEQSNAFRDAMRAAREVKTALAAGAPLPPPVPSAPDPSLIPCPHCSRRFNAKAAERHIPQCQNIIAKPATLKRGGGRNASKGPLGSSGGAGGSGRRGWQ